MFFIILQILFSYYISLYIYNLWKYRKFNGPLPLPIIGNLYNFKNFSLINLINRLSKEYGKIYKFFIFSRPFIVITDLEIIKEILSDNKNFNKNDPFYKNGISLIFGQSLLNSDGNKYKNDKSIFHKYFIKSYIYKYNEIISDITKKNIENLKDIEKKEFNIENFFAKITLKIILKYGFDIDMSFDEEFKNDVNKENKLCHFISNGSYLLSIIGLLNIPHWNFLPVINKLNYYREYCKKDLKNIIINHKKKLSNNPDLKNDNIISIMLENNMTLDEMTDHYVTILGTGQDTSSYLMSYMAYLLAKNQDVQDKVRKEFNSQKDDDYSNLPYFDMVINETLRLYSIAPHVLRNCDEDVAIKNIIIPKKSTILIPFYILNRDPNIWINPNIFDPDRFKDKPNLNKLGFFPFSYGKRVCIGQDLAKIETKIVMYNLIKNYKILPVSGFKPNILAGISLTTKNGIYVILEKI